jgi:hypothetical protein
MRPAAALVVGALLAAACTDRFIAPASCPDFCADAEFRVVDTLLATSLGRDTTFRGYVQPHEAVALSIVSLPSVEGRALLRTQRMSPTRMLGGDPTEYPIAAVDSLRLALTLLRPDTTPRNLTLSVYRVAKTIDSATTFADVAGSFIPDSLARRVNLDDLFTQPVQYDPLLDDSVRIDPATGDMLRVDRVGNRLFLRLKLDSAQAPFVAADSAELAFGIAVTADDAPSAILGSRRGTVGDIAQLEWFFAVDSAGMALARRDQLVVADFDSFVFDPAPAPVDDTQLAVGGAPSARSLLRLDLPRAIRDSGQVIRATLLLVPQVAALGVPADSFVLAVHRVQADLGAKSPLAGPIVVGDSTNVATAWVHVGATDTVRVEVTRIVRLWTADTAAAPTFVLRQLASIGGFAEGVSLSEIRFYSSRVAAWRPTLHVTYMPRIHFGVP